MAPTPDTAAAIYTDLRDLTERLTALQHARLLTLEGDPSGTNAVVHQALRLLDRAAEQLSQLETLDL